MISFLLLPALLVSPAEAPARLNVVRHGVSAKIAFNLVATGDVEDNALIPVPPGATTILLPRDGYARISGCEGGQVWCGPANLETSVNGSIEVHVFPFGRMHATLSLPKGIALPTRVLVHGQVAREYARAKLTFSFEESIDRKGRFSLWLPQTALDIRLTFPSFAPVYYFDLDATQRSDLGSLHLVPGGSIAGRVRDVEGMSLSAVDAYLFPAGPRPLVTVGQESRVQLRQRHTLSVKGGFFQFEGLEEGRYSLEVRSPNHSPTETIVTVTTDAESFVDDILLEPLRRVDITLTPATDSADRPWRVGIRSVQELGRLGKEAPQTWATASTEGLASFTHLTSGPQEIEIRAGTGTRVLLETIDLPPYPETEIPVRVPLVLVEGRVRRGQNAVPDAQLVLRDAGGGEASFKTDASGDFHGTTAVPPTGELLVEVIESGETTSREIGFEHLAVKDDRLYLDVNLGSQVVTGVVVDQNDDPVSGASVSVDRIDGSGSDSQSARTDASGSFSFFDMAEGRHIVTARADQVGLADPQEFAVSKESVQLRIRLMPGWQVRGTIHSAAGIPVAAAHVQFASAGLFRSRPAQTDAMGRFTARLPQAANLFVITVWAPSQMLWSGCRTVDQDEELSIVLPPGPAATIQLEDIPRPSSKKAVLLTESGGFLRRTDLEQWRFLQQLEPFGTMRSGETMALPGMAPGLYRIVLWPWHDEGGLVTAACSGFVADLVTSGGVAPGGHITLSAKTAER